MWIVPLALIGHLLLVAADITVTISDVKSLPYNFSKAATSATDLLNRSCPEELSYANPYRPTVLMSSFADFGEEDQGIIADGNVFPSSDGLVRGAIEAWAQHQHLVLRPDEIWFEILAQLNFYMTAHAEDIRHLFVDHEGKEEIEVWEFTWRDVVAAFAGEIQARVKTDWLLEWIMPDFTTTTESDELTATVLMMGLMQHYFEFSGGIVCGLPAVTLLGEREDWVQLLDKLDHLDDFGPEPASYAQNLRPILERFVNTWDNPNSQTTRDFWKQIVRADRHFSCGAGPIEYDVSGWITGFMHWTPTGDLRINPAWFPQDFTPSPGSITLDGITYFSQELTSLSVGYAKAPLKMLDYPEVGTDTMSYLLAGNVAVKRQAPKKKGGFVKAQPLSAWFLYAPVDTNVTTGPRYGQYKELEDIARGFKVCQA
ncbi:hypothetical protein HJFPF1_08555 [Paramyrothecium foliicola]|nr:hypothetical protein HJFPF1_08555 [Paramyrothecium foliicola]